MELLRKSIAQTQQGKGIVRFFKQIKHIFVSAALDLKLFTFMAKSNFLGYFSFLQNVAYIMEVIQNSSYLNFSH